MPYPPLYTIQHADLQPVMEDPLNFISPQKQYTVFWWQQIPLGHLFVEDTQPLNREEAKKAIWTAILPAIAFYAKEQDMDVSGLEKLFYSEDIPGTLSRFRQLFSACPLQPENDLPTVSLVICTRNRAPLLRKCLLALQQLNYPPSEVIIVDNAPDDDSTRKLVALHPGVRYIKESRKGLDYARNRGIGAASSPVIAFTDDDVELHPDWIWRMARVFKDPKVQALTGLIMAKEIDTKAQYYFEKYWSFNRGYRPIVYGPAFFKSQLKAGVPVWMIGAGAGMAFRRTLFDAIGTFDTRLDMGAAGCSGDSEIWYRVLAEGWNIRYDPLVIAYHTHRREKAAFKKQIYQYMRGFSAAVLIEYQRYRHRGDLSRLFRSLPSYYFRNARQALTGRLPEGREVALWQEIKGYISGIGYYWLHRKQEPFEIDFHRSMPTVNIEGNPLVSIIITTYNHGRYLADAVESVIAQTYANIELVIVDDGSTDNTPELLQRYPSIKYIYQSNEGLSAARNKGIDNSKGSFIIFLDADDWLYPNAVVTQLRHFRLDPGAAFIAGSHDKVNGQKRILTAGEPAPPPEAPYAALLQGNFIGMHAAVMYREEVFNYFRFDTGLKAGEDYDLYLRIARLFAIGCHSEKIAAYRIHEGNMSADTALMLSQVKRVLQKQYALLPVHKQYPLYKKGWHNWKKYYTGELMHAISQCINTGNYRKINIHEWKLAVTEMPFATMALFTRVYVRKIKNRIKRRWIKEYLPAKGRIKWGDLRRAAPLSREFGYDRGGPVDRYYIERFLDNNSAVIRGRVLEIGDSAYTRRFGGTKVSRADVLHIDEDNRDATITGDLSDISHVAGDQFDCIILTQTLHLIYNFSAALQSCYRILRKNGVLLLTVPGISNIDYGEWAKTWYWSFTAASIEKMLAESFGTANIKVQCFGNLMAATAFLHGMGTDEISAAEKDAYDPHYQLIIAACATKL